MRWNSEIEKYLISIIDKDFSHSSIRFKKLFILNENTFRKHFDFLPIHKCLNHDFNNYENCKRTFSRSGIKLDIFEIREGDKVKFLLPTNFNKNIKISGMAYLMGPRSGNIHFQVDQTKAKPKTIVAYDQFCYYERLGAIEFDNKYSGSDFFINQYSGTPSTKLLKGEKNYIMPLEDSRNNMKVIDAVIKSKKNNSWMIV